MNQILLLSMVLFNFLQSCVDGRVTISQNGGSSNDFSISNVEQNNDYLYQKDKFATYYFSQLKDNFGYNNSNCCGYIAAGMLLSFFDTYWDDNIIADKFESDTELDELTFQSMREKTSPGTTSSEYNITKDNFDSLKDEYFELYLMDLGNRLFDRKLNPENNLLTSKQISQVISKYMYSRGYLYNDFYVSYQLLGGSINWNKAIDEIKDGNPVIMLIKGEEMNHFVIGYDYSESTDTVYVHSGLHKLDGTHTTIEKLGFSDYLGGVYMGMNNKHIHTKSYFCINDDGEKEFLCPCSFMLPWIISFENYFLDTTPSLIWRSLWSEKWFSQSVYYRISILNINHAELMTWEYLKGDTLVLDFEEFSQIVNYPGKEFYVKFALYDYETLSDVLETEFLFEEPSSYRTLKQVTPEMWGFDQRYYFENEGIKKSKLYKGSLTFETERLRCGYIEDKYVILSPRREDAGEAYLKISFNRPVYYFGYSVLLWSNSEYISTATLKFYDSSDSLCKSIDLLSTRLPVKYDIPLRKFETFSDGISSIEFYVTAEAIGDRNKGRLCIDDLIFSDYKNVYPSIPLEYEATFL